jgi:uncharacterized protein YndB with AHSA1/START domain
MKWVFIVIGAIVLLGIAVTLIGAALPQNHTATVSRTYPAPAEVVWRTITDVEQFASWRTDLKSVERVSGKDGRLSWREKSSQGELTLEVLESDPPKHLVTRIADEGLPFGGQWTYELAPAPEGTLLSITENGEVYNPFFRFVSKFIMGHDGTLQKYHESLERKLNAGATGAVTQRR